MKKAITALLLGAACLAGPAVEADDLHLPGGGILPLGPDVVVWDGSHSYLARKAETFLASPEAAELAAQGLMPPGLCGDKEKKEAAALAESLLQIARSGKVCQLRSVHGNTMYNAAVLSVPLPLPDGSALQKALLSWAVSYEKAIGHGKEADTLAAHGEFSELARWAEHLMEGASAARGVSAGGIPYEMARIRASYAYGHYTVPFYVWILAQTREGQMVVTVVWSDQAGGRYLEPYLKKAAEEAK